MFCLPFMVHTGSDITGRLRKTMTMPLRFPNVCVYVSVCNLTSGEERCLLT